MTLADDEIERLIASGESDRIECKESVSDKDKICQAICAFANDLPRHGEPGIVVVGVDDRGNPTGLVITDKLLQDLADLRSNGNIHPFPSMVVEKRQFRGREVVVVTVEPSNSPPVRFKGRTWIRVGSRRSVATAEEEMQLAERRRYANLPFDAQPLPSAGMDALDVESFVYELLPQLLAPEIVAANHRDVEEQLTALRFLHPDGEATPTGVLFVGIDTLAHLPGSVRNSSASTALTLPIPSAATIGSLAGCRRWCSELEEVLRANIDTVVTFEGRPTEARRPSVPFEALQQLIRNAVMHRSYQGTNAPTRVLWFDDRIRGPVARRPVWTCDR